jgi:hypothetical protein
VLAEANDLLDTFAELLQKKQPPRAALESLLASMQTMVPALADMTDLLIKVRSLFA